VLCKLVDAAAGTVKVQLQGTPANGGAAVGDEVFGEGVEFAGASGGVFIDHAVGTQTIVGTVFGYTVKP
jgi:hypothetical protein